MKLATTLTFFLGLFSINIVFGQDSSLSKHQFRFYVNDIQDSTVNAEISIIVLGDTIKGNKLGNFYYFPILDTANNFDIEIKSNKIVFSGHNYRAWMLNHGSRMTFGKITKFKKLLSVAKYNGMTKNDEDWARFSKKFFIIDHVYTIDIENKDKVKELQFLIISPNNSNSLLTIEKII